MKTYKKPKYPILEKPIKITRETYFKKETKYKF